MLEKKGFSGRKELFAPRKHVADLRKSHFVPEKVFFVAGKLCATARRSLKYLALERHEPDTFVGKTRA